MSALFSPYKIRKCLERLSLRGQCPSLPRMPPASPSFLEYCCVLLLGSLHLLEPEFNPSWRFLSQYELGEFGWLMRLAFLALATRFQDCGDRQAPRQQPQSCYTMHQNAAVVTQSVTNSPLTRRVR